MSESNSTVLWRIIQCRKPILSRLTCTKINDRVSGKIMEVVTLRTRSAKTAIEKMSDCIETYTTLSAHKRQSRIESPRARERWIVVVIPPCMSEKDVYCESVEVPYLIGCEVHSLASASVSVERRMDPTTLRRHLDTRSGLERPKESLGNHKSSSRSSAFCVFAAIPQSTTTWSMLALRRAVSRIGHSERYPPSPWRAIRRKVEENHKHRIWQPVCRPDCWGWRVGFGNLDMLDHCGRPGNPLSSMSCCRSSHPLCSNRISIILTLEFEVEIRQTLISLAFSFSLKHSKPTPREICYAVKVHRSINFLTPKLTKPHCDQSHASKWARCHLWHLLSRYRSLVRVVQLQPRLYPPA